MTMTRAAGGRQRAWLANDQLIYSRVCSSSSVVFSRVARALTRMRARRGPPRCQLAQKGYQLIPGEGLVPVDVVGVAACWATTRRASTRRASGRRATTRGASGRRASIRSGRAPSRRARAWRGRALWTCGAVGFVAPLLAVEVRADSALVAPTRVTGGAVSIVLTLVVTLVVSADIRFFPVFAGQEGP